MARDRNLRRICAVAAGSAVALGSLMAPLVAGAGVAAARVAGNGAGLLPIFDSPAVVAPVYSVPEHAVALGRLPASTVLRADVVLEPRDPSGLAGLATAVSTPGSPVEGDYRTPAELRRQFSPTTGELRATEADLRALGLTVLGATPDRLTVHVVATAARMSRAMRTEFERYRLPGGRVAYTNSAPAELPGPVGTEVMTVVGLSTLETYTPLALSSRSTPRRQEGEQPAQGAKVSGTQPVGPQPCAMVRGARRYYGGYTATQLAEAYHLTGLYSARDLGAGITVGVVEFERDSPSDIAHYEACYGIKTRVSYVKVDGGASGPAAGQGEAALDIEDVAGLAPAARIVVYQAPNTKRGVLDELQWIVDHPRAKVVSNSWGQCETVLGSSRSAEQKAAEAESTLFEYAAAEGQTWLSAAGDEGSADCFGDDGAPSAAQEALAVDDPGSQPYVTSVGGTRLRIDHRKETVWNDAFGASGGGISSLWPMPAYQAAAPKSLGVRNRYSSGVPCAATAGYCREVPDVSADADPETGYLIYWSGGWLLIGGTSAAAPLWAAVVALTDASSWCGGKSVGYLNPALYSIAGSSRYRDDFTDITSGDNNIHLVGTNMTLYPASKGYDMASGLGTPIVATATGGLARSLCSFAKADHPGVDSISPATGPGAGGYYVTITGYGFAGVTAVDFGSVRAESFVVLRPESAAPTAIRALVPPGSGTVYVTVIVKRRSSPHTPGSRFTYENSG